MRKSYLIGLIPALVLTGLALAGCAAEQGRPATRPASEEPAGAAAAGGFTEYPIGDEVQTGGLNIAAVYFQPVVMEPSEKAGLSIAETDIHIEADIHALQDNQTGFGFGEWVPYMTVKYKLKNQDNGQEQEGTFMPMNASDGPHYGANIKMMGAGQYSLTFIIESPEKQGYLLHVDKETGVPGRFWTKPIEVSWDFDYIPRKF